MARDVPPLQPLPQKSAHVRSARDTMPSATRRRSSEKTFWTLLLPPPVERLGPREAVEWLRSDFPKYHGLSGYGFSARDPALRRALGSLALDLGTLVEACAEAIAHRRPVRLGLWADTGSFQRHTRDLERVMEAEAYFRARRIPTGLKTKLARALRERRRIERSLSSS